MGKNMKRDEAGRSGSTSTQTTTNALKPSQAWIQKSKYQSGDKEGEDTNTWLYVMNPAKGLNDRALEAITALLYPGDKISTFNKQLNGFATRVHTPKQAKTFHSALRAIDSKLPDLDLKNMEAPDVNVVSLEHVNLPETNTNGAKENVTAVMLDGFTYPLYKKLRKLEFDFVRGVHGSPGANRWVREVKDDDGRSVRGPRRVI